MKKLMIALVMTLAAAGAVHARTTVNVKPSAAVGHPNIDNLVNNYAAGTVVAKAVGVYLLKGDHVWTNDKEWLLYGVIVVDEGATLTIEEGTIIRGMNSINTEHQYRPGMLVVDNGGKLYANGTPALPIVFTDQWDNHFPMYNEWGGAVSRANWNYFDAVGGTPRHDLPPGIHNSYDYSKIGDMHGAWGGIILCGNAFLNWDSPAGMGLGNSQIPAEGLDVTLGILGGGNDDDDSSGELSYVQIRYGGFSLADGKEINGLTLYGVGRGTKLHHIEVYNNLDDSFEWFGGCANAKYLVAWGVGDDIFDSDAGFRGKNQFLFGVQRNMGGSRVESGASDKGMEMDGYEKDPASGGYLLSASLWANVTLVGMDYANCNYGSGNENQPGRNVALSMRDNVSPRIYNSIFMDFGSTATLIENRSDGVYATPINGILRNAADRFASAPSQGNFPSVSTLAADGRTADFNYLYRDGAMGDDRQAVIRGCTFWNIRDGLYSTKVSTGVSASGNPYRDQFPWTSDGNGSGPWVSSGKTAYTNWFAGNSNNDFTSGLAPTMPILSRLRTQVTKCGTTAYDIAHIDPRAAANVTTTATPVPDAWMTPVRFRGAFEPTKNWAKGWTVISTLASTNASGQKIYGVFGETSQANALTVEGDVTVGGEYSLEMDLAEIIEVPGSGGTPLTVTVTNGVHGIVYQDNASFVGTGSSVNAASNIQVSPVVTYTIESAGVYQLQSTASLSGTIQWTALKTFTVGASQIPVTVNLTDIVGETPPNASDSRFYRLQQQ